MTVVAELINRISCKMHGRIIADIYDTLDIVNVLSYPSIKRLMVIMMENGESGAGENVVWVFVQTCGRMCKRT